MFGSLEVLELTLPNVSPLFVEELANITIDVFNSSSQTSYILPDIFDMNNDSYTITI